MREWLATLVGEESASIALIALIALAVLVAMYVVFRILRFMRSGTYVTGGRGRQIRLAVIDATPVDEHRRLVLVRRDEVEHLILIGGPTDVVVESGIGTLHHPNLRAHATAGVEAPRRAGAALPEQTPAPPVSAQRETATYPAEARRELPATAPSATPAQVESAPRIEPGAAAPSPLPPAAHRPVASREPTDAAPEPRRAVAAPVRMEPQMRETPPQGAPRPQVVATPRSTAAAPAPTRPPMETPRVAPQEADPFGDSIADIEDALCAVVSPVQPVAPARPAASVQTVQPQRRFEHFQRRAAPRENDNLETEMERLLNSLTPREPKSGS